MNTTNSINANQEQPIALLVEHHPEIVLLDEKKRDALFEHINNEIAEFKYDLTTKTGRDAAISFAARIVKTKTAADAARKQLTEEWRTKTAAVNESGKAVAERLTEMAKRARQPVTDWENAEEDRIAECEAALTSFTRAGVVAIDATSADVKARIEEIGAREIDPGRFQGMTEAAIKARNHALELLAAALERIEKAEADAAELEELRKLRAEDEARRLKEAAERQAKEAAEQAERDAKEAAEREAKIAAERAEEDAKAAEIAAQAAEERRQQAERDAEEAKAKAAAEAAESAAAEAKRQAEAEAAEVAAKHEAQLAEERARAAELERAAQAQRDADAAEAERRAKAESDMAHRTACKAEAKAAMLTAGITEDQARKIVLLILSGEVPRVSLDFAAESLVKPAATESEA